MESLRSSVLTFVLAAIAWGCGGEPRDAALTFHPREVALGATKCDSCRMSIEQAPFVTQCRTVGGDVLVFDDPGCLAIELECGRVDSHEFLFRHVDEERWLTEVDARFVRHDATPMDFGFAAVDAGRPEGIPFEAVRRELNERFVLRK